jgi:hypothetical protein
LVAVAANRGRQAVAPPEDPVSEKTAVPSQVNEFWKKGVEETTARMQAGVEELAKLEQLATEQARVALNDMARLQQESLTWANKVSAEWRRMGLDAFRKSAELFMPRA